MSLTTSIWLDKVPIGEHTMNAILMLTACFTLSGCGEPFVPLI